MSDTTETGPTRLVGIEESAHRIGRYRWAETHLFEALGGWTTTVPEPDVRLLAATHAHQHAWHAELWRERLPILPDMIPEPVTSPADAAIARVMDATREPAAADLTIEKLVGVYRVLLPRLVGAYTCHLARTNTLTDAPTARTLRLVLRDEREAWCQGEIAIQGLLRSPEDVDRAGAHQVRLERLMVDAGGIAGDEKPAGTGSIR